MASVYEQILNKLKELDSIVKSIVCCPKAKSFTPTGTADTSGATGEIAYDSSYIYIKTAAGWKRSALSAF